MPLRIRNFLSCFLTILSCFMPVQGYALSPSSAPALETLLKQIENRHYRWVAFRADVVLFFVAPGANGQAMCGGEPIYERLQERMLLSCQDSEENTVFVFRTLDRLFDLYIPSQNTLYHGSIFDLEDSPDVESHLKMMDLYRALKPGMFDPNRSQVESSSGVSISLNIFSGPENGAPLSRKIYLTPQGDVLGELFFDQSGQVVTEIQRYDFREIPSRSGGFETVIFPKKVTVVSPRTGRNTAIFFSNIKPLDTVNSYQFLLRIPKGTREVYLREVDPRFAEAAPASSAQSEADH